MAINPQFKVNKMAKDMGLKSKDLTDILSANGIEVKTQRTLEPREFDILFETLTRGNQITNIEDYLDGVTCIPRKAPAAPAEEKKAPVEPKAEPAAPVQEKKAQPAPAKPAAPAAAPAAASGDVRTVYVEWKG